MSKPTDFLNLHFILPMDPTCHINFLIFLPTSLLSLRRCRDPANLLAGGEGKVGRKGEEVGTNL